MAQNQKMRVRDIRHLIRMNFTEDDYWITLTYKREERPPDIKSAKHEAELFRKRVKRLYDQAGVPMKWIQKTEIGKKGGVHHHLIMNRVDGLDKVLAEKWKKGRAHFQLLYKDGDFVKLAEYVGKQEGKVYDYTRSRNLLRPKRKKETMNGRTFGRTPKKKGYELEKGTLHEGVNPMGWPYRRYAMRKLWLKSTLKRKRKTRAPDTA